MFPANTKILIVDDMSTMRSLIKGLLKKLGLTNLVEAEDGERAFALLKQHHEMNQPVELVLSDWNMPTMTGIELLRKVRSHPTFANLPFVMITAEGETPQVKEAIEARVSNYIKKPFSAAVIQEKLAAVYAKSKSVG